MVSRIAALALIVAVAACHSPRVSEEPRPVATRASSVKWDTETVHLATPTGRLEGSLVLPRTPPPWPVVLIIAGSGPTDRDGNSAALSGGNNSLRLLAEALGARGIASVRYDKRGIGASQSALTREADIRFDTYVDDAASWIQQLQRDSRFKTITIIGHSEGSLVGMLAAEHAKADAFVSIAGAGRLASQLIHEQLSAHAPAAIVEDADRVMDQLKIGMTTDSVPAPLLALFRPSVQPYLISWFHYDPAVEIRRLHVPVLIMQGTTDIQVSVKDARLLAAASPTATLYIIDGMNHVLKMVPADKDAQLRSYSNPTLPVAPSLIDIITAFVNDVPLPR